MRQDALPCNGIPLQESFVPDLSDGVSDCVGEMALQLTSAADALGCAASLHELRFRATRALIHLSTVAEHIQLCGSWRAWEIPQGGYARKVPTRNTGRGLRLVASHDFLVYTMMELWYVVAPS